MTTSGGCDQGTIGNDLSRLALNRICTLRYRYTGLSQIVNFLQVGRISRAHRRPSNGDRLRRL